MLWLRRRHITLLRSLVCDAGSSIIPVHTILEVYRCSDMALVGVLPSAEDEVNAATWHPFEVKPALMDIAALCSAPSCKLAGKFCGNVLTWQYMVTFSHLQVWDLGDMCRCYQQQMPFLHISGSVPGAPLLKRCQVCCKMGILDASCSSSYCEHAGIKSALDCKQYRFGLWHGLRCRGIDALAWH